MPFLSLTSLHEQLLSLDEKAYEERRTRKIPDRAERFFEARFRTQRCRGDQVLEKLNQTLDMFEPRRAPHQVIFHRHFIRSCLPKIYGADWDQMAPTVLARMGLREIKQETLVVTPRRYGKTVAVAMFCAAMIYCVSDLEIGIFSTGKRAAAKLMAKTWQLFMQLPGAKGMIKSKNAETAIVHDIENVGDERTMSSYPASTKTIAMLLVHRNRITPVLEATVHCPLFPSPMAGGSGVTNSTIVSCVDSSGVYYAESGAIWYYSFSEKHVDQLCNFDGEMVQLLARIASVTEASPVIAVFSNRLLLLDGSRPANRRVITLMEPNCVILGRSIVCGDTNRKGNGPCRFVLAAEAFRVGTGHTTRCLAIIRGQTNGPVPPPQLTLISDYQLGAVLPDGRVLAYAPSDSGIYDGNGGAPLAAIFSEQRAPQLINLPGVVVGPRFAHAAFWLESGQPLTPIGGGGGTDDDTVVTGFESSPLCLDYCSSSSRHCPRLPVPSPASYYSEATGVPLPPYNLMRQRQRQQYYGTHASAGRLLVCTDPDTRQLCLVSDADADAATAHRGRTKTEPHPLSFLGDASTFGLLRSTAMPGNRHAFGLDSDHCTVAIFSTHRDNAIRVILYRTESLAARCMACLASKRSTVWRLLLQRGEQAAWNENQRTLSTVLYTGEKRPRDSAPPPPPPTLWKSSALTFTTRDSKKSSSRRRKAV